MDAGCYPIRLDEDAIGKSQKSSGLRRCRATTAWAMSMKRISAFPQVSRPISDALSSSRGTVALVLEGREGHCGCRTPLLHKRGTDLQRSSKTATASTGLTASDRPMHMPARGVPRCRSGRHAAADGRRRRHRKYGHYRNDTERPGCPCANDGGPAPAPMESSGAITGGEIPLLVGEQFHKGPDRGAPRHPVQRQPGRGSCPQSSGSTSSRRPVDRPRRPVTRRPKWGRRDR